MDDGGDDYYHNDAEGGKSRKKKLTWTRQEELVLLAVIAVHGKYDGKIDVKPGDIFHEQHRDYLKASREQKTNKGLRWSYFIRRTASGHALLRSHLGFAAASTFSSPDELHTAADALWLDKQAAEALINKEKSMLKQYKVCWCCARAAP
jgi:hypothetical protein